MISELDFWEEDPGVIHLPVYRNGFPTFETIRLDAPRNFRSLVHARTSNVTRTEAASAGARQLLLFYALRHTRPDCNIPIQ